MIKPIYIVTSKMLGQKVKLDSIADNVANVNTTGFKKLSLDFQEVMSRQQATDVGSFTMHRGTQTNFMDGGFTQTSNPLDVALQGDGFFSIQVGDQVRYTRDGNFTLDSEGNLMTKEGYPVLDANNAPIAIPPGTQSILVSNDGSISSENGPISQLAVVEFENKQQLLRAGSSWISQDGVNPQPIENPTVRQGFLESSNVEAITEMTELTKLMRSYQGTANLMNSMEDLEQRIVRDISRMPS